MAFQPGPQVLRKARQCERLAGVVRAGIGRRGRTCSRCSAEPGPPAPAATPGAARYRRISSLLPRVRPRTARSRARATSGPRRGWWADVSAKACRASSAEAAGSVAPRASAASASTAMATSSPGSALAASWVATSTGRAPRASSTSAPRRSNARRTAVGTLARTASRIRSCPKASRPSNSVKRSACISDLIGANSSGTDSPLARPGLRR